MIDGENEAPENDFAAFEASANAGDPPADDRREDDKPNPETNDKAEGDETLDLTEDDEIVPEDKDDAAEPEKKRHKTAKQRIDELTAKLRQSERDLEAERSGRTKPAEAEAPPELVKPDPNDEKYEFGEADPKFIADNVRYELKIEQAERDKARGEEDRKARAKEVGDKLDADWTTMKARGAEKHDDFAEKVDALEVSQPILALAIQASPVGDDAAYHLANAPHEMAIIEARIAAGDIIGAAERFGEIEGAAMDTAPVKPTNGNPLDIALYAGRLKTFVAKKPKVKLATDAPEPPEQRVRGASGQFEVSGDTNDFAAFEAKVNGRAKARR